VTLPPHHPPQHPPVNLPIDCRDNDGQIYILRANIRAQGMAAASGDPVFTCKSVKIPAIFAVGEADAASHKRAQDGQARQAGTDDDYGGWGFGISQHYKFILVMKIQGESPDGGMVGDFL